MATFHSKDFKLQLDVAVEDNDDGQGGPCVTFKKVLRKDGCLGEGLVARINIREGQTVSFVLRNDIPNHITTDITPLVLDGQQHDTQSFWFNFIAQSKYRGRWMEVVTRSLMILKMLTYGKKLAMFGERGWHLQQLTERFCRTNRSHRRGTDVLHP